MLANNDPEEIDRAMLPIAAAGGILLQLHEETPDEQSPCGFDALHGAVSVAILDNPVDKESRIMLVGMLAAGCMVDVGIKKPTAPPTPDGAFDVFSDWAHMEGRSFGDLKRVYKTAADFASEMYALLEMMSDAMRVIAREGDSDASAGQ